MTPLVLAVAPTGARRTRDDHPGLPIAPGDIAREAAACREAGASVLHLHVRDRDGRHTLDPEAYRAAWAAVRKAVGERLVIQVTSEAAGLFGREEQMAAVRAVRPEAVSLALREIIPDPAAEADAARFLAALAAAGTGVQYILYAAEELARFRDLRGRGVVPAAHDSVLFVLGRYGAGHESAARDLLPWLDEEPAELCWMVCAFGPAETDCATTAAALGGHARVGFENSLWRPDGSLATDTAEAVTRVRERLVPLGRPLADADTARSLLGVG